ncbi:protein NCBP2AS2 homolog [Episyrphus balteatus]|uniref:protein NCBP2AS2 homolog n=1 Tax=Episyrphus balteatus TaxID=286459 RepID=UPI002486C232|nr:protein NCBP2AS2 homolog [Episyrphus balteatus]
MVLRILFRYLANNEQLIQKMSESYPMRRAAQLVVAMMIKTKSMAEQRGLSNMTPEKFREFFRTFNNNLKQEIEGVKEELKKKK